MEFFGYTRDNEGVLNVVRDKTDSCRPQQQQRMTMKRLLSALLATTLVATAALVGAASGGGHGKGGSAETVRATYPRTVCTGRVHADNTQDWSFRLVGRPL